MLSEMLHPEVEEKTLSSVMRADKIRGEEWRAANPLDFMKVKVKGGPAIGKAVHEQRAANREKEMACGTMTDFSYRISTTAGKFGLAVRGEPSKTATIIRYVPRGSVVKLHLPTRLVPEGSTHPMAVPVWASMSHPVFHGWLHNIKGPHGESLLEPVLPTDNENRTDNEKKSYLSTIIDLARKQRHKKGKKFEEMASELRQARVMRQRAVGQQPDRAKEQQAKPTTGDPVMVDDDRRGMIVVDDHDVQPYKVRYDDDGTTSDWLYPDRVTLVTSALVAGGGGGHRDRHCRRHDLPTGEGLCLSGSSSSTQKRSDDVKDAPSPFVESAGDGGTIAVGGKQLVRTDSGRRRRHRMSSRKHAADLPPDIPREFAKMLKPSINITFVHDRGGVSQTLDAASRTRSLGGEEEHRQNCLGGLGLCTVKC